MLLGRHTSIAKTVEQGTGCYYPWGVTSYHEIDPGKTYELSIWILSTGNDLSNFFGFRAFDKEFKRLSVISDNEYSHNVTNPYFKRSKNDATTWTRWNGFAGSCSPEGTRKEFLSYFSKGVNWEWPLDCKYIQLTFGTCYGDGDNQGKTYFARPQVTEYDTTIHW